MLPFLLCNAIVVFPEIFLRSVTRNVKGKGTQQICFYVLSFLFYKSPWRNIKQIWHLTGMKNNAQQLLVTYCHELWQEEFKMGYKQAAPWNNLQLLLITHNGYFQPISIEYSCDMVWCMWGPIGIQSNDVMSRQGADIHTQLLLTPTTCTHYLLCPNHLETCISLVKSVSHLGKIEKVISNSHLSGDYFLGCMDIVVLLSCYENPGHPLTLRKGRLDTRLFTSNPHVGMRDFQLLPAMWELECPDHVDLAILSTLVVTPTIQGKVNSLCI